MNQPNRLRWGILGAARVNERLLPAIVESPNAQLVAIASRRPGAAAETLQKYAPGLTGVTVHESLEALLQDGTVQAVYLPMANEEHATWALKAIAAGKHVLIEKPMALTVGDIDAIAQAAAARGVKVMEGFMYRFHPQHARVAALINSGLIGEIRTVRASFAFMMRPARMYRIARDIDAGGGALWDIGPYAIHTLRSAFGREPVAATAMARRVECGADVSASGVLDFGEGRFGHFDISFEHARRCEYEITGTLGGIQCHMVWAMPNDIPRVSWWTEAGEQAVETLPTANHFNLEIEHFSRCVLEDTAPDLSLADARANCQALVAVLQSIREGRTAGLA